MSSLFTRTSRIAEYYRTTTHIVAEDLLHLFRAVSADYALIPQLTIHDIRKGMRTNLLHISANYEGTTTFET